MESSSRDGQGPSTTLEMNYIAQTKSAIDDTRDGLHRQGKDPNGGHFNEIKKNHSRPPQMPVA